MKISEKNIIIVSGAMIVIGLFILFFYAEQFNYAAIETIDTIPKTEEVKIKGVVKAKTQKEKAIFLQVTGEKIETTEVIIFSKEDLFLQEGNYVEIIGIVEEYKGKKEIIASQVVVK